MSDLICPKCRGEMRQYERSGVVIDQCGECRGIFLDRGELEKLFEAEANWSRQQAGPTAPAQQPGGYAPPPPPPAQHQPGYGAVPPPPPPPPAHGYPPAPAYGHQQQQQHYGYHGHYRQKKRKSFLDEMFG
ncbi:zf-TFIIB domain-containing protein [Micromonospora sp. NPDC005979]|uniref:TFIIB-type zinc ribbon-containing protein n=1 Tax=Micromonospora sp. NPDC005979 TaxID=3156726 RepID=UPI0033A755CD